MFRTKPKFTAATRAMHVVIDDIREPVDSPCRVPISVYDSSELLKMAV